MTKAFISQGKKSLGQKCTKMQLMTKNIGKEGHGEKCTKTKCLTKIDG